MIKTNSSSLLRHRLASQERNQKRADEKEDPIRKNNGRVRVKSCNYDTLIYAGHDSRPMQEQECWGFALNHSIISSNQEILCEIVHMLKQYVKGCLGLTLWLSRDWLAAGLATR